MDHGPYIYLHAELFFSCVRQMLGGLTHPSAAAFSLTFRLENILFCFSVYILSFKGSFHFRALVIVKHIKIMWDDRANIKWDPDVKRRKKIHKRTCDFIMRQN